MAESKAVQASSAVQALQQAGVRIREDVREADMDAVRAIVVSTGFFHDYEVEIAVELVRERLARGAEASGYYFVFAERPPAGAEHGAGAVRGAPDVGGATAGEGAAAPRPIAYTCYGPIACTQGSFDLFWIAVDNAERGGGIGRLLLTATEERIAAAGGRRVYVETSGRPQYDPTRRFYERCGYTKEAVLSEFYGPGDDKVMYVKAVEAGERVKTSGCRYTIRNAPPDVDRDLRRRAKRQGRTLNALVVELPRSGLTDEQQPRHRDRSHGIVGTWVEDPDFDAAIAEQDRV